MLALIGNLDTTELIVVVVAALLVFGRRLPQVAAQAGTQLGKLRRTLDSAWKDSGVDKEVREVQRSIESIRDAVPRDLSPASIARTAANEFQRRVEVNQQRLEQEAALTATAATSGAGLAPVPTLSAGEAVPSSEAPAAPAGEPAPTRGDPLLPRPLPGGVEAHGPIADPAPNRGAEDRP